MAKYWKNAIPVTLSDGTKYNPPWSIAGSGNDVYTAGMEYNGTNFIAKYWKNATTVNLSTGKEQTTVSKKFYTEIPNASLSVFPNPLSDSGAILFTLSQSEMVSVSIYDIEGRLVKILADAVFEKGQQALQWDAGGVNANIYSAISC